MRFPPKIQAFTAAIALLVSVGCTREIGDGCNTGTDCSQTGGRTCDTTMPGGYCTIANCEPNACPEEAACIGFFFAPSTASECSTRTDHREVRQFCMRRCSSQDDCRSGYVCAYLNEENNPWGAKLLDSSGDGRVCTRDYDAIPAIEWAKREPTLAEYCAPTPFSDPNHYYAVGGASGVSTGTAGAAGAAGASAAGAGGGAAAGAAGALDTAGGTSGGGAGPGAAAGTAGDSSTLP